jgi:hypothetical protein
MAKISYVSSYNGRMLIIVLLWEETAPGLVATGINASTHFMILFFFFFSCVDISCEPRWRWRHIPQYLLFTNPRNGEEKNNKHTKKSSYEWPKW